MTEPKRLLEEGGPSALLLASATDDGPSAAGFERTAKRLGLAGLAFGAATLTASSGAAGTAVGVSAGAGASTGAGTGLATSAGAGAGATSLAGAAGSGALGAGAGAASLAGAAKVSSVAGVVGFSMFAKVIGVATVGLAIAAGAAVATSRTTSTEPLATTQGTQVTPVATLAEPRALPKPTEPVRTESPATEHAPNAAPDPDSAKPSSAPAKPTRALGAPSPAALGSPEDHALRDEVAILDEARAAISRGQSDAALSALARHRKEFPRGFLSSEADVLRVEALVKAGRTTEAKVHGEQLLAREPNGPQAKRVRSLLGI